MAKLKTDAIQEKDFLEYLNSYSDFSFELSILKMLRKNGLKCEHGGLYEDPVTGKSRQFDIRSEIIISKYKVRLAIECKNIRDNFPVLISCVPRHDDESYHQVALVSQPRSEGRISIPLLTEPRAKIITIKGHYSIYKPKECVGKSTVQVGRASDGSIVSHDSDLFDKWSQCLSSAKDLVSNVYWDNEEGKNTYCFSSVFPVVVIPDGRLWIVKYDDDGNRISNPELSDRCSCFVDMRYGLGTKIASTVMWLSHVEIMTFKGLHQFVAQYLRNEIGISSFYPNDAIIAAKE